MGFAINMQEKYIVILTSLFMNALISLCLLRPVNIHKWLLERKRCQLQRKEHHNRKIGSGQKVFRCHHPLQKVGGWFHRRPHYQLSCLEWMLELCERKKHHAKVCVARNGLLWNFDLATCPLCPSILHALISMLAAGTVAMTSWQVEALGLGKSLLVNLVHVYTEVV